MTKISFWLFIALAGLVFWKVFLPPGPRTAADFPYPYRSNFDLREYLSPQTWKTIGSDGLGYYSADTLWAWPLDVFLWFLGNTGLPFWLAVDIIFILLPLTLSYWGMSRLLSIYQLSPPAVFIGTVFHFLNSYFLLLIDGGQLSLAIAYSLIPLAYYLFREFVNHSSIRRLVPLLVSCLAISIVDFRFLYLLALLLGFNFLFEVSQLRAYLITALSVLVILAGFHAYWWIPVLTARGSSSLPVSYTQTSQLSFLNFTSLGHSLFLLQPHWYKNIFGQITSLRPEFALLPLLVFSAPFLVRKNKHVFFWLTSGLVFIFLTKGAVPPYPQVYSWLFSHIPGFFLFRDSTKFFTLVALAYAILLAFTVDAISKKFRYAWLIVLVYLIFLARPAYLGQMTGLFSLPPVNQFRPLADFIESDSSFGRVTWVPYRPPLGIANSLHPALEASILLQKRPFAIGAVGRYEAYNFLRESPFMGEIFNVSGIEYLVNPPPNIKKDPSETDNLQYYNTFLAQLSYLPWLKKVDTDLGIPVLKTKSHQDRFFLASSTSFVLGPDEDMYLTGVSLSQNALIFSQEQAGLTRKILSYPFAKIYTGNQTQTDLIASLAFPRDYIFPSRLLQPSPDSSGWWKRDTADLIKWRDFLQQKYQIDNLDFDYGGGWSVSEGKNSLTISDTRLEKGKLLLARVMKSDKGGKISFLQENTKIGEVSTFDNDSQIKTVTLTGFADIPDNKYNYSRADFHWELIGELFSNQPLTLFTEGQINVVNSLLVIDQTQWVKNSKLADELLSARLIKNMPSPKIQESSARVSYNRLESSHYQVRISGLTQPGMLIFSENYHPLWKMQDQKSLPIYSLVNGFTVNKDGVYDVVFSPQKYVPYGLIVTAVTMLFLGTLWIFSKP